MSNNIKKEIKNKQIQVLGIVTTPNGKYVENLQVTITNDMDDKIISIGGGPIQFEFPLELIEEYLK